ncbi:hypothetical protein M2156_008940 [Streptomyces sp. SAI-149]|nr:hypothetical protein [Streptomyces sp. SAI-149]
MSSPATTSSVTGGRYAVAVTIRAGFGRPPSRTSRSAFPRSTSEAVMIPRTRLGHRNCNGSSYRLPNPSEIIAPKLGTVLEPTPRKASPDWTAMDDPARNAVAMITGPRTTVRTCRRRMRRSGSPETRAASTYSSFFTPRTRLRTSR